jgi:hypothetical protein
LKLSVITAHHHHHHRHYHLRLFWCHVGRAVLLLLLLQRDVFVCLSRVSHRTDNIRNPSVGIMLLLLMMMMMMMISSLSLLLLLLLSIASAFRCSTDSQTLVITLIMMLVINEL